MIVEVLNARTGAVVQRVRVASLPFTIGRSLDNALVIDDPHVDAWHARLVADDEGEALVLEDLGSVNGISLGLAGNAERERERVRGPVRVRSGAEVRLGRTALRFRDEKAVVAAAVPLGAPSTGMPDRWHARTSVRLAFSVAVLAVVAIEAWLNSAGRSGANEALGAGFAFGALIALWAGVWATVARVVIHRARFVAHLAIAALIALAFTMLSWLAEWMQFLFPDAPLWPAMSVTIGLGLLVWAVALHLANASLLAPLRRWTAGVVTSAVVLALAGIFALADADSFTDVPEYESTIKPLMPSLVPTITVEALRDVHKALRDAVDSLAAEPLR